ncbi:MAG: hypothetical protein ACK416_05780 [Zestosphaera sp.]
MLRRVELLLLIYILLATSMNVSLFLLGESRVDAYVAVNVLTYLVSYVVVRPFFETPPLIKVLNTTLLLFFTVTVFFRIYEVLVK